MKYFSTFSGIGGFELGIHRAFDDRASVQQPTTESHQASPDLKTNRKKEWGAEAICVGYSEIDKYAIKVYEKQFPGVKNYGDITKINAEELPDFELLVGGFPCQAFSIAGKRRGFDDTRGTLFFDLARILRAKQPRYFVFENVKGLLSHDQGNTFRTIITTIDELGYDCQWQVLNSKDFGVPQNRERVYIVGHLRGTGRPQVFPLGVISGEDSPIFELHNRRELPQGDRAGSLQAEKGEANSYRVRRLTPVECERLQGFPDDWTKYGTDGEISDTQRYKMCGNAVTVNVVQAVMERLIDANVISKEGSHE